MAFILAGDMGVQGAAAAPPPAVETRVAGAPVATGKPFSGWRLVAQGTSANSGSMGAPGSVSTPGNGSNGMNGPTGTNGTSGTNQGVPDYGPSGGAGTVPTPGKRSGDPDRHTSPVNGVRSRLVGRGARGWAELAELDPEQPELDAGQPELDAERSKLDLGAELRWQHHPVNRSGVQSIR